MPSAMATSAAAFDEAGWKLAAALTAPERTLSSLRVQPDFSVKTAGQTIRLKFALELVSRRPNDEVGKHTWEMTHL